MKDDWTDKFEAWKIKKQAKREINSSAKSTNSTESSSFISRAQDTIKDSISNAGSAIREESKAHPAFTKFLIFLAFAIPLAILGYALYVNYTPFGYENTYTLTIDNNGTISPISSEFYLTNTQGRKLLALPNGVNGQVNFIIQPKVVIKNAKVNISIEGTDVGLATSINFNASNQQWDYNWDFTQQVPQQLNGTAQFDPSQNCTYFDARKEQTLSLPNSQDLFESGPFTVYVKWKPSDISKELGNYQQIIGHYNWELWQDSDKVEFRVGRMNDENGTSYDINYQTNLTFFNTNHEALAIYSPDKQNNKGYIELWIDNQFASHTSIGNDTIYQDYNGNKFLTLGWSPHNYENNPHFDGCLYKTSISNKIFMLNTQTKEGEIQVEESPISIPIVGNGNLIQIKAIIEQ